MFAIYLELSFTNRDPFVVGFIKEAILVNLNANNVTDRTLP